MATDRFPIGKDREIAQVRAFLMCGPRENGSLDA